MHVCDQNCQSKVFYDNFHVICRVSRRISPNGGCLQKRPSQVRATPPPRYAPRCALLPPRNFEGDPRSPLGREKRKSKRP